MLSKLRFFYLFYNAIDNANQYLILHKISFRQIRFQIRILTKDLNILTNFINDFLTPFHT